MDNDNKKKLFILALLTALLFTVGCSRVTQENYDKLKIGMEYNQVTALLGKPDNCTESMVSKSCTWGDNAKNIRVNFVAGKAVVFSGNGLK